MLWASLFTAPFGLTEPLFVPEYWSPPSLFDLARRTGFDIESLVFCFGIGGVGAILYNVITGSRFEPVSEEYRRSPLHRHHKLAIAAPFIAFPPLYFLPWNPIYAGITAMVIGTVSTIACRPDLKSKTWAGGFLFLAYYWIFLFTLDVFAPGYIERVWNLEALTGIIVARLPLEELLFAFSFGMYWAGVYDHFTWRQTVVGAASRHGFWRSRAGFAAMLFLAAIGLLLAFEHRAHLLAGPGFLVVLVLLCVGMHLFMHRGHEDHGTARPHADDGRRDE